MKRSTADFSSHELIKTAVSFFRRDVTLPHYGWTHPVYFDRNSNIYRVLDFPKPGIHYEFAEAFAPGNHTFELDEPYQYARDLHTNIVNVKIVSA